MDVFVLAGLAVLPILLALVWLVISNVRLSDRVRLLEQRLASVAQAVKDIQQREQPVSTTDTPLEVGAGAPPPSPPPVPEPDLGPAAPATQGTVWAAAASPPQAATQPQAPDWAARLGAWLRDNWVYAVAALSLAAAGVFLVQYGMERGLLPPGLRVLAGMAFGAALIAVGEYLRRRFGDGDDQFTAYLPQVFSGAGLVSVFAALLAGRLLYGLIGPEVTFAGLVLTALGAMALGWLHGPLLAALGLVGASVAPFLTGGGSTAPAWLMAHYGIVAVLGLGIDTLRRWGWVSVLALVLAYLGGGLLKAAGAGEVAYLLLAFALPILSIAIPARGIFPDQQGPSALDVLLGKGKAIPAFPMKLAIGTMLSSGLIFAALPVPDQGSAMLAFVLAAAMVVFVLLWADRTPALHDLALIPAAAFLGRLALEGGAFGPLHRAFRDGAIAVRAPDVAAPMSLTVLMALAGVITAALALRSKRGTGHPVMLAAGAAAVAPVAALIAEFIWQPSLTLGAYSWALHVIALAALMVGTAATMAGIEVDDPRRRTAHAALSALVLIALAVFILTTKTALTLALAVLVLASATLDRRFRLREMEWAVMAGVMVIGWRLSVDPGLAWSLDAPLIQVVPSYLGPVLAFAAAIWALRDLPRPAGVAFLESGLAAALALLVDILLARWLDDGRFFVLISTLALPWLIMALVQLYRMRLGGILRRVRIALASIAGAIFSLGLIAVAVFNPVITGETVAGPLILDTLLVAYALPAALLILSQRLLTHLPRWLRWGTAGFGAALAGLYVLLEIRRFWRGDDLSVPGTSQPELYTYTVALLILGAALLWRAITTGSQTLRRVAMGVIGLTAAKVFLIDASGLSGLMRVFSFLALGLALAGLAALNRWAASHSGPDRTPPL